MTRHPVPPPPEQPKPEPPKVVVITPTTPSDQAHPPVKVTVPVRPEGRLKPVDKQALLATFSSYVGIREVPLGSNNGPMVNKFNASCALDPSEHAPWCASVTHYGYDVNGADDRPGAYSPSWYRASRKVALGDVEPGDVALVWFPSKGRYAHTIAAVEKVNRVRGVVTTVTTLEGNTNSQGSREGDQFARRVRAADSLTFVRWWN